MTSAPVPSPVRAGSSVSQGRRRLLRRTAFWIVAVVVGLPLLVVGWGAAEAVVGIARGKPRVMVFGLRRMDAPQIDPRSGLRYREMGCVVSPDGTLRAQIHNWMTRGAADLGIVSSRVRQMRTWDAAQELLAGDSAHTLAPGERHALGNGAVVFVDSEALRLDAGNGRMRTLGDAYSGADPECDDITFALDPAGEILLVDVSCPDRRHGYDGDVRSYDVQTGECIQWIQD